MITSNKIQNIGNIYRLTEQFELISRTDLAKLSGLAPASITNITKQLIVTLAADQQSGFLFLLFSGNSSASRFLQTILPFRFVN